MQDTKKVCQHTLASEKNQCKSEKSVYTYRLDATVYLVVLRVNSLNIGGQYGTSTRSTYNTVNSLSNTTYSLKQEE